MPGKSGVRKTVTVLLVIIVAILLLTLGRALWWSEAQAAAVSPADAQQVVASSVLVKFR